MCQLPDTPHGSEFVRCPATLVLVLSAAVLVIVIDAGNLRCDRAGSDYDDEHRRYATEHEHEVGGPMFG